MAKLTHKQKLFVEYYLQHWNATLAAEQAQYRGNRKTLGSVGTENLAKPAIKEHIEKRLSETVMTSNEVLSRLGNMARSFDVTKYITLKERFEVVTKTVNGEEKHYREFAGHIISFDLEKLQRDGFSHLIKKIKQTTNGIEIEWHDQRLALVDIGKHHKLFTDNLDITSDGKRIFKVSIDES